MNELDSTFGAGFIAAFVCAVLFGVASLQVYLYYHLYPNDQLVYRLSVGCFWMLDALSTCLLVYTSYHYLISGFGDYSGLLTLTWSNNLNETISLILVPMVQSLYGYKVWQQRENCKIIAIFVPGALVAVWATSIKLSINVWNFKHLLPENVATTKGVLYANFTIAAFADIVNTLALCRALYKPKKTFFLTKSLIRNLMLWIIGTGILTCCVSIAVVITLAINPTNLVFLAISYVLAKLYINGYLAMLNVRRYLSHSVSGKVIMLPPLNSPAPSTRPEAPITIHIANQKDSSWASEIHSSQVKDIVELHSEVA